MLLPHSGGPTLIERLPEPTRPSANRPSWPERDETALAPTSAEQSYLRPFSRSAVGDGENRISAAVLSPRWSSAEQGERRAITTVHRIVHYRVHLGLAVKFHDQNEMQEEQEPALGHGMARIWAGATRGKRRGVAPAQHRRLRDDAMPRSEGQWERKTTRSQMVLGEEGNSYALQFRLLRLLHPAHSPSEFGKGSWPKVSAKSSKLRTTETGGSDPGNFGLSRPKLSSGSLPPCCSHFAEPGRGQRRTQTSSHAHFNNPRMQEGEG